MHCATCGLPATRDGDRVLRTCTHDDAAVTVSLRATVTSTGTVGPSGAIARMLAALRALGLPIGG